jgi:3-methyladenine DNA glycosylase AlkD
VKERYDRVIQRLLALENPENIAGMAKFGIRGGRVLGISVKTLRGIAKEFGKDHALALKLWDSGMHEARILASIIADKKQVTAEQMERWTRQFDSWDVCDQCCTNLFVFTPFAWEKAHTWSADEAEFVKRAGFVLMAQLANKDKKAADERFNELLTIIERESHDERNFVKKAVNWALREIGGRNAALNTAATAAAQNILQQDTKAAKWVARDALRELQSEKVRKRLYGDRE